MVKYGFGVRGPGYEIRKKLIPDPGVKKAPDTRSGSATLLFIINATTKQWRKITSGSLVI
jgi:hypothetical protein